MIDLPKMRRISASLFHWGVTLCFEQHCELNYINVKSYIMSSCSVAFLPASFLTFCTKKLVEFRKQKLVWDGFLLQAEQVIYLLIRKQKEAFYRQEKHLDKAESISLLMRFVLGNIFFLVFFFFFNFSQLFPGRQPVVKLLETLQEWLVSLPLDKIPYDAILDLVNNKMRVSCSQFQHKTRH